MSKSGFLIAVNIRSVDSKDSFNYKSIIVESKLKIRLLIVNYNADTTTIFKVVGYAWELV